MIPQRVLDRALDRVIIGNEDECWLSTRSTGSHGYAVVGWGEGGNNYFDLAHRVVFTKFNNEIPSNMTVDHTCHVTICCNPKHLRLLPNLDNARDNGFITKTHCPAGHEYSEINTYIRPNGHRACRTCRAKSSKERWLKTK